MAEVTAALLTFSDAAICGSDGSRILVASVPVAASAASTAICTTVEEASGRGLASIAMVWSAMERVPVLILNYVYHIKRDGERRNAHVWPGFGRSYFLGRHCERSVDARDKPGQIDCRVAIAPSQTLRVSCGQ